MVASFYPNELLKFDYSGVDYLINMLLTICEHVTLPFLVSLNFFFLSILLRITNSFIQNFEQKIELYYIHIHSQADTCVPVLQAKKGSCHFQESRESSRKKIVLTADESGSLPSSMSWSPYLKREPSQLCTELRVLNEIMYDPDRWLINISSLPYSSQGT